MGDGARREEFCEWQPPVRPLDSSGHIQIRFDSTTAHVTDLRELEISLAISLTKANGQPVEHRKHLTEEHYKNRESINFKETNDSRPGAKGADSTISCVNSLLHSLFQSVEVRVGGGGTPIEVVNDYCFVGWLDNALGWTVTAKKNVLNSTIGWFQDQPGLHEDGSNEAFEDRIRYLLLNGKRLHLKGKLALGVSHLSAPLPTNCPLEFIMRTKPADFVLYDTKSDQSAVPTYKIKMHEILLGVKRLGLTSAQLSAQEAALKKGVPYYFDKIECKSFVASEGHAEYSIADLVTGKLPEKIYLGLISNESYNGNFFKNPYKFSTYQIQSAFASINGSGRVPTPNGYHFDFANGKNLDGFLELYDGNNFHGITLREFLGGNFILTFDLNKHMTSVNTTLHQGTVSCHLKFKEGLPEVVTVLAWIVRPCKFVMNEKREVSLNYIP